MRAWLLCACAVAAAAPAGLEETADRLSRVVRIFDAAANLPGAAAPLVIRDAEGRAYACDAGGSAADSARPALAGYLTWRSAQACATWAARGSYWSYEVCFGNSPSVSQTSKDTQRTLLGAPSQRPPEARSTETLRGGIFADILTDANVLLGGGPVVVERFEGGFQGRSADVYVFCGVVDVPDATEAKRRGALVAAAPLIYKIVEEPEKLYHVAVVAPKACDDAELAKLALRYETRTLRHRCATRRVHGEWWTFEVCLGGQVSQFRQDEATGEREGGFVIGSYSATVENDTTNATRPRLTELYYGGDLCVPAF